MFILLFFACQTPDSDPLSGPDTAADTAQAPDPEGLDLGEPITATPGTWTWVDFPDATCGDGTPTGIAVNVGTTNNLIVFFEGGGACWDATTCLVLQTSSNGPVGQAEFDAVGGSGLSLFSREDPSSPFKDWSMVDVPYCTGDLHAGSTVVTYTTSDGDVPFNHTGHSNVLAYLKRLGATFESASRVAVVGTSSGGAGTLMNYPDLRRTWPDARMYLVDDSAPLLVGDAMSPTLRSAWTSAWDLSPVLTQICGDDACEDDLSVVHASLAADFPSDRMALLSSRQDRVFASYVGLSGDEYQAQLELLASEVLAPSGAWQPFFVDGDTHSLLFDPTSAASNGVTLQSWLTQMVTDSDAWTAAD